MFSGSCVALVTPFCKDRLDEEKLRELVSWHLEQGTSALVPCGSTGEAATLTHEEYRKVIRIVLGEAKRRVPVIAGVSSNATWKAVELFREVAALKVDAALVLVPYYNKPTQEGLFGHFQTIARSAKLPIVVYNIPGRTAVNLAPKTLLRLARDFPQIVAVKEASGNLDQVSEILGSCSANFSVLSGDDSLTLPMLALGARGVVSVAANLLPQEVERLCRLALEGDWEEARKIHHSLFPLIKALFLETNPIPVKFAMDWAGLCSSELRPPLSPLAASNRAVLVKTLKSCGLKPGSSRRGRR